MLARYGQYQPSKEYTRALKGKLRAEIDAHDMYRVTHRSGRFHDVRALGIFDARRWAEWHFGWEQNDMHVRIVEISNISRPTREQFRFRAWLANALPFNLWR